MYFHNGGMNDTILRNSHLLKLKTVNIKAREMSEQGISIFQFVQIVVHASSVACYGMTALIEGNWQYVSGIKIFFNFIFREESTY